MKLLRVSLGVTLLGFAATAQAEPDAAGCPPGDDELTGHRYLRALSLDLRGVVPRPEEYLLLENGQVPESLIDEWLASEEFLQRAVRLHRDLLWNNVFNVNPINNRASLRRDQDIYWRFAISNLYRGERVRCLDEPAEFNPDGSIVTKPQPDGTLREGWVIVEPYWAPGTQIRVCAFDGQDAMVSPLGTRCGTLEGLRDVQCGCGPNLSFCQFGQTTRAPLMQSLGRDVELRIEEVIREDKPYLDLFSGDTMYVNGPLAHYWRYQAEVPNQIRLTPRPVDLEKLPDIPYTGEDDWVRIEAGPDHSGVLTSPAFLLRFQTNRARANRFYNSFLCQPFVPPDGGLGEASAPITLDLQQRDGCKYCHGLLEPAAAYWGRWGESGAGFLDPERYPPMREDCQLCATGGAACSDDCRRYYVTSSLTEEEDPYLGWLTSYEFLREEHMSHVERGPSALVDRTVVDGRFGACTARTASKWLLGREPRADEQGWLDDLAVRFASSGHSYRDLVKAIVTSPAYRRVR